MLSKPDLMIAHKFGLQERAVVFEGDCLQLLQNIPDSSISLVVTSPPYNIGKAYERQNPLESV